MKGKSTGYTQLYRIDSTGIACLDLRSERSMNRVCHPDTYDDFLIWIRENADKMNHLFLVLSVPIIYNNFSIIEKPLDAATQLGYVAEVKDDLQDHWRNADHQLERLNFLKLLLNEAIRGKFRITILSGDVHIGCAGVVYNSQACKRSNAAIINSLITSPVVNIPPPTMVKQYLKSTGSEIEIVDKSEDGVIKAGLYKLLGDPRKKRYFSGRNYLELVHNTETGTQARWFVEDESEPFQIFIHPFKESDKGNIKIYKDISLRSGLL